MGLIDGDTLDRVLDYPSLVAAMAATLAGEITVIPRNLLRIPGVGGAEDGFLGIMPAWIAGRVAGVKLVTGYPGNAARGLPGVSGVYVLVDAGDGRILSVLDGTRLTARRTAAMAALAALRLAPSAAETLLVVGTGAVARELPQALRAARDHPRVIIWGRDAGKAQAVAEGIRGAEVASDLEAAVRQAGHIACATSSRAALIRGEWVRPGTHVTLVGSFRPDMREADTDLISRASVWADRVDEVEVAGDIAGPVAEGAFRMADIRGDLTDIARAGGGLRRSTGEITVFKSAGHGGADLAAATLAWERVAST